MHRRRSVCANETKIERARFVGEHDPEIPIARRHRLTRCRRRAQMQELVREPARTCRRRVSVTRVIARWWIARIVGRRTNPSGTLGKASLENMLPIEP